MEVMTSADGGKTEHLSGRTAPITGDGGVIALPPWSRAVITFATSVGAPSWIGRSADGGKTPQARGVLQGRRFLALARLRPSHPGMDRPRDRRAAAHDRRWPHPAQGRVLSTGRTR